MFVLNYSNPSGISFSTAMDEDELTAQLMRMKSSQHVRVWELNKGVTHDGSALDALKAYSQFLEPMPKKAVHAHCVNQTHFREGSPTKEGISGFPMGDSVELYYEDGMYWTCTVADALL